MNKDEDGKKSIPNLVLDFVDLLDDILDRKYELLKAIENNSGAKDDKH